MATPMERNIARMTWMEVRDLDKANAALVLPIGSLEQHGPHLSVDTDLYFSERFLEMALERLTDDAKIYRLPTLPISKSNEHVGFPGSFWLAATMTAVVQDIAASAQASGFRRLVLWNCHGGNRALLEVIVRDVRADRPHWCFSSFRAAVVADPLRSPTPKPPLAFMPAIGKRASCWRFLPIGCAPIASRPPTRISPRGICRLADWSDGRLADSRFPADRHVGRCDGRNRRARQNSR